jgi:hypothetical protein
MWKAKCSMFPSNPDDNSPSKSRLVTNFFIDNGKEQSLEVRSEYDGVSTRRLGELVLWMSYDQQQVTAKLIEAECL